MLQSYTDLVTVMSHNDYCFVIKKTSPNLNPNLVNSVPRNKLSFCFGLNMCESVHRGQMKLWSHEQLLVYLKQH